MLLGPAGPCARLRLTHAAGDIHDPLSDGVRWLAERANGRPVIYVPGNHEWYAHRQRFTIYEETARASALANELGIHLLQDAEVEIDGVRFLDCTLWTDYQIFGGETLYMRHAKRWMNDHRVIFPTEIGEPLDPAESLEWHLQSKAWLDERLNPNSMAQLS